MPEPATAETMPATEIADMEAIASGDARLTPKQALRLLRHAPLHELGAWANERARRIHGDRVRTYVIDRNVNYTNVCSARCTFCAFRRDADDADAYVLDQETLHRKLAELVDQGGTQVLLQGGMHPELSLSYYEDMLAGFKQAFPDLHIHGFSPPEFVEFVAVLDVDGYPTPGARRSHELPRDVWLDKLETVLRRLQAAGLDSVPGGGGEIFAPHVRQRIGLGKASTQQWLDVMRTAHKLGMWTSATMMFGHVEGLADRVDHMQRIRDAQDEAIAAGLPGRYISFISWPFQRENTPMGRLPDWDREGTDGPFPGDLLADQVFHGGDPNHDPSGGRAGKVLRTAGATEYLRTQAISRLFLDNIWSIGSSWVTMGPKIGQVGLFYGANDMGSVMMEENVVSAAGTTYCLNEPTLCRLIRDSGFIPAQRDNLYRPIRTHDRDGPDLSVEDWSATRPAGSAFG